MHPEDRTRTMIRAGDTVRFLPQWQDPGDDELHWVALEDEDGGRVLVEVHGTGLFVAPTSVVLVSMLEGKTCAS